MLGRSIIALAYSDGGNITSEAAATQLPNPYPYPYPYPNPNPNPNPNPKPNPNRNQAAATQLASSLPSYDTDPLACERVCVNPEDAEVAAWLRSGGVRRLVVGHKPSGDSPAVLCSRFTGLEVISADRPQP